MVVFSLFYWGYCSRPISQMGNIWLLQLNIYLQSKLNNTMTENKIIAKIEIEISARPKDYENAERLKFWISIKDTTRKLSLYEAKPDFEAVTLAPMIEDFLQRHKLLIDNESTEGANDPPIESAWYSKDLMNADIVNYWDGDMNEL